MADGSSSQPLNQRAFGWPGIPGRWTPNAKSGVGKALASTSHVWFTLSHGIFNEIYYPRIDQACIRDMALIVTFRWQQAQRWEGTAFCVRVASND